MTIGGKSGELLEKLLDSVWCGGGVRCVELTEREQALLAGFVLESGEELEAIVFKVGGWAAFGLFLRGFAGGLGLGLGDCASAASGCEKPQ
mgnify:CR=1 FL=1